jgi:hypothetical protein
MQSDPASHAEYNYLATDFTTHLDPEPPVLTKSFFVGVTNGLIFSTICWILLYPLYLIVGTNQGR